jgi:hypothetical protein
MRRVAAKRLGWGFAVVLAGFLGAHTAGSQTAEPKVWKSGETLTASDLNASFAAALAAGKTGTAGAAAVLHAWTGFAPASQEVGEPQPDGHVARFTFNSPVDGAVYVSAHFEVRVRNSYDGQLDNCMAESLLSANPGFAECGAAGFCSLAGYAQSSINANLPTQYQGGSYLGIAQSAARVLPVTRGVNIIYLNGRSSCPAAVWGAITMSALFVQNSMTGTVTMP